MAGNNRHDWKRQMVAELKHDRRKALLLAALAVAGTLVIARQIVVSLGPAQAGAEPAADGTVVSAQGTAVVPKASVRSTEEARRDAYIRQADRIITRDLFQARLEVFPLAGVVEAPKVVAATAPSSEELEQEKVRSVINQAQKTLTLQSVVMSDQPTAIINGIVLKVGERISDFVVVAIESQFCQLRKDDVTVRLLMQR